MQFVREALPELPALMDERSRRLLMMKDILDPILRWKTDNDAAISWRRAFDHLEAARRVYAK